MTQEQVIIGMDPHMSSNTIAVLTRDETVLTRRRFQHSDDGFVELLEAVADYPNRVWAIEGANGMGRSIAQRLVAFNETVIDVPAKLATRVRVSSTGHGTKTDAADAMAIARAAIHSPHLRRMLPDDAAVAMKLISDRRKELVGLRTQAMCRLHRLLRELIPGGAPAAISAETAFGLLNDLKPGDPAGEVRLEIAIDHIEDVMRLDRKIDDYTRRIVSEVKASGTTLTRIYGVGPLNAALIIGEVGDVSRFPSRDHFASYSGAAPISASSGDHQRHRLNRAGNRTLNHQIDVAIAQVVEHGVERFGCVVAVSAFRVEPTLEEVCVRQLCDSQDIRHRVQSRACHESGRSSTSRRIAPTRSRAHGSMARNVVRHLIRGSRLEVSSRWPPRRSSSSPPCRARRPSTP